MKGYERIPAVFMRGGTSKAIIFHRDDLPPSQAEWDSIFLSVMGSPDLYGRQLDGMGGGTSTLSKVCVVARSERPDADVDYTFAQVSVKEARVDYGSICGNMTSAIGPFAVSEGLVTPEERDAVVRIFNTNTQKIIHASFSTDLTNAKPAELLEIPGVSGRSAAIKLDFIEPGGATTGRLLPTGRTSDVLNVPDRGVFTVSLVDAANACMFIEAAELGLCGNELPSELASRKNLLELVEEIRRHAAIAMGIASTLEEAALKPVVPFVVVVSEPQSSALLSGGGIDADNVDMTARAFANGQPHLALPITASLCTAVAAAMSGTIVNKALRPNSGSLLRIGMPSGMLTVTADVTSGSAGSTVRSGSIYRTAKRLFDGHVYL